MTWYYASLEDFKIKASFDYGEYEKLYADKRTEKVLSEVDKLAKKMKVKYALIGGLATYIHVKNPPEDYPDIDFQLYCDAKLGRKFLEALALRPKFELGQFAYEDQAVFGMFIYDDWVQVDIFTDIEDLEPRTTKRAAGVELNPVEYLIIEKMIRGNKSDVKSVLDLMAFSDYDKRLLHRLAKERHLTGAIGHLEYFSRRIAAGRVSSSGIKAIVDRIAQS